MKPLFKAIAPKSQLFRGAKSRNQIQKSKKLLYYEAKFTHPENLTNVPLKQEPQLLLHYKFSQNLGENCHYLAAITYFQVDVLGVSLLGMFQTVKKVCQLSPNGESLSQQYKVLENTAQDTYETGSPPLFLTTTYLQFSSNYLHSQLTGFMFIAGSTLN